jgi:hypothetical protein
MDIPPPAEVPTVIRVDFDVILYLASSSTLGLISAFAALLGNEEKALSWRPVAAYLIAGALVSLGLTFFLAVEYGFSYFLLGVSIFAGYKAFDTLAIIGMAVSTLIQKLINRKNDDEP